MFTHELSESVGKKDKKTNKRLNKSVNDLLLGINLIYKSKTVKAYFAFITWC